ncbi:D-aminoacyl-tRNA deacylase [Desulfovibrio mangrovi]|uniref:D-aminoacyl-tRNA deacylase n=1 Tax=Desulfovibrio mangrovi TaxID=2976983 RepID=UPI002247693C|nr:D-aminoacyl-tRNA deacylase [Desulfovibrio mangrovi]UZP68190.1 D-aminoacyl-tRNA deacylase [Desulfovibrio mangrovi]
MKLLIQRAKQGQVSVDNAVIGKIDTGLVVLVGFGQHDDETLPSRKIWQTLLSKMLELRIFPDSAGKMNLSLLEYGGKVLLIPQFTLYADARKGRRPSFTDACPPQTAEQLFGRFVQDVRSAMPQPDTDVQCGRFGAEMDVSLTNWGPVTISLTDTDFVKP